MSEPALSLPLKVFNDKIRIMNQTQKRDLLLSAVEARNLHTEIFALLAQIADLSRSNSGNSEQPVLEVGMDGGGFK